MKNQNISDRIMRHPDAEAHFGVALESLSAFLRTGDDGEVRLGVYGEIRATECDWIRHDISIVASAHDDAGRVLYVLREPIEAERFYKLRAFGFVDFGTLPAKDVTIVKIYPSGY